MTTQFPGQLVRAGRGARWHAHIECRDSLLRLREINPLAAVSPLALSFYTSSVVICYIIIDQKATHIFGKPGAAHPPAEPLPRGSVPAARKPASQGSTEAALPRVEPRSAWLCLIVAPLTARAQTHAMHRGARPLWAENPRPERNGWRRRGSNPRPRHCERRALPTELRPRN